MCSSYYFMCVCSLQANFASQNTNTCYGSIPTMHQSKFKQLTSEEVDKFMQYGYLRISQCFSREQAADWCADVWTRLGFDPKDKASWTRERTNMPSHEKVEVSEFAPKVWDAIFELCGGEDRVSETSNRWNDALIVNLGSTEFEGKVEDPKELQGWHVDGNFFVHFLDSAEQGLLVIPLFTNIEEDPGGTMVCPDGIGRIARHLRDHAEGVSPRMIPRGEQPKRAGLGWYSEIMHQYSEFHEMTGKVGDVILLHPLMFHSATRNRKRYPRIITNPPVGLRLHFNFDREDAAHYSLVEKKTLQELGVGSLKGWQIKGEREFLVPERVRIQEQTKNDEVKRLQSLVDGGTGIYHSSGGAAPIEINA